MLVAHSNVQTGGISRLDLSVPICSVLSLSPLSNSGAADGVPHSVFAVYVGWWSFSKYIFERRCLSLEGLLIS